jgi:LEA14-like dessication related protein
VESLRVLKSARLLLVVAFSLVMLAGCAGMFNREEVRVNVVGIEPVASQGLELRFNVKLRLQNPTDSTVNFNGVSLEIEVNNQTLASGVSSQSGSVPRFGETLISVPVTVPAFSAARQVIALASRTDTSNVPFVMNGRLAGGAFGSIRFSDKGTLPLPDFAGISQ